MLQFAMRAGVESLSACRSTSPISRTVAKVRRSARTGEQRVSLCAVRSCFRKRAVLQFPAVSIGSANESIRFRGIRSFQFLWIPLELLASAKRHVAQVIRLRQPTGILEVGTGWLASFAGVDPLGMMAGRPWDGSGGPLKSLEFLFRQQYVLAVVGKDHSFAADENTPAVPLRDAFVFPDIRFALALMPDQFYRWKVAARSVFIRGAHRSGRDLRMW